MLRQLLIIFALMSATASNSVQAENNVLNDTIVPLQQTVPDSAHDINPLGIGKVVPNEKVNSLDGTSTRVRTALKGRPTLITFYRGGWCPYCNTHLAKLASIQDQLEQYGIQIIAVSPDTPERLRTTIYDKAVRYELFSDSDMSFTKAMGLAYRVDDKTVKRYKKAYGIDIEKQSGQSHRLLPVPAAFLVDRNGLIQFQYYNAVHKGHVSVDSLLAAAKQLALAKSS